MATGLARLNPTVLFQFLDDLPHLHEANLSRGCIKPIRPNGVAQCRDYSLGPSRPHGVPECSSEVPRGVSPVVLVAAQQPARARHPQVGRTYPSHTGGAWTNRVCLKRYVAREIYRLIVNPGAVPAGADLRVIRVGAGLRLHHAATALGTTVVSISRLELGHAHDTGLAQRYERWLGEITTSADFQAA